MKMEWPIRELSRNMTTSSTTMMRRRNFTYQQTQNTINKNMTSAANTSYYLSTTAFIHLNASNHQISFHPEPVSSAYSGYKGMKLAPWLTGIIFALVVFVILIPAFCSACYHYYSYKHGFDEESYDEEEEDLESSEDSFEDERMNIMTVSRSHRDLCDGYFDNHIQGTNTVFPVNPSSAPRDIWCDDSESYSELKEFKDEKSKKKDVGIQSK